MLKTTLIKAALDAGKLIKAFTAGSFAIQSKDSVNNLVTEADHASEKLIISIIRESFPDHYILTEETGAHPTDSQYKWIIDPIDGTVNFANGIPICCVSIGIEKDGEMLMGAVYNPFIEEFFFAEKDKGAFLNDQQIHVSKKNVLMESCLVTGFPYKYPESGALMETYGSFIKAGVPVRRLGSAAIDLCWVACGRFDGYYEYSLNAWDSAAGFLIVEEAGGKVTDFKGNRYSPYQEKIIATNGQIHDQLVNWINQIIG